MAQKISRWLLITLILTLGFGQLLRFDFYGIPIYLHDVLVFCLLLLQGQALKVGTLNLRGLALKGIKIFLIGLSLGWLNALLKYPVGQLLVPSLYSLRLLAYLTLYLLLKELKLALSKTYFYIAGITTLTIGLLQYFLLPDMRIFQYLGWDDHLNRLILPHFDPTFTAVILGLTLLIIPLKYWYVGLLFSLGILLTYSRSVWLSLVITSTFFIKKKIFLLFAVGCMLLAIFVLPRKFGEGTNLLRTYSISSRYDSDISYIQKYKWDLLIGHGMNTLVLDSESSKYDNHATGPNSSYLYLLTTTGILGLVGWGIFMYSLYQKSNYKPMLIFFFIASLFNNVMFYPFALLWVFLTSLDTPSSDKN